MRMSRIRVQAIVGNGDAPLEFFPEGTRSRRGIELHPKYGLLNMAIRPYFRNATHNIAIFPIGISYEERMESHLYASTRVSV